MKSTRSTERYNHVPAGLGTVTCSLVLYPKVKEAGASFTLNGSWNGSQPTCFTIPDLSVVGGPELKLS